MRKQIQATAAHVKRMSRLGLATEENYVDTSR